MITVDDVKTAYRYILGQELEEADVAAAILERCSSIAELRHLLLYAPEFRLLAPASVDDIRAAYRFILGREAEHKEVVDDIFQRAYSVAELRQEFLNSREFRSSATAPDMAKPLDWTPMSVETNSSQAELAQMLRGIEKYWREIDVPEVHWSLHHRQNFASSDFTENEENFYRHGEELIKIFRRTAERCGLSLNDHKVCLELGCGVGRLTVWLSEIFPKILGVDISQLRIDLNRRALRQYGRSNVDHHRLITIDSIASLPDFDVFFSIIVLQHNPPPIIITLLNTILGKLNPGGIGYFQIPTFIKDYSFSINSYLRDPEKASVMEMHAIPQRTLFQILQHSNCELLEIREDPWTESNAIVSNSIFVKKRETTN
jgi:2-polyprenyl-3-methyl-5-hydroxy-6-metoxy-1,4-benzoquinol methylase